MGEREYVFCEDCDAAIKEGPTWRWLCLEAPRAGNGFVTRVFYDKDDPYERCVSVNQFGNCRWFTEIPQGTEATDAGRAARGKKRGE